MVANTSNTCCDDIPSEEKLLDLANANTEAVSVITQYEQYLQSQNVESLTSDIPQTGDSPANRTEIDDGDSLTEEYVVPTTGNNIVFVNSTEQIQGAQGTSGIQGQSGPTGPAGSSIAGPQGVQGSTGTGTSIWTSSNNGSLKLTSQLNFVNTSTVRVTVSNNTTGMTNVFITAIGGGGGGGGPGGDGAQGSQGAQGSDNGPQGPQGAIGVGTQGVQGVDGIQGTQGTQGETGSQGIQGIQGDQGAQGETGVQGTQGSLGLQGEVGAQGVFGAQGLTGVQGAEGDQGLQGSEGPQGVQGEQGIQGDFGVQGADGVQGQTGPQGTQGTTGIQGDFGAQGLDGVQGSQGVQGETGAQGVQGEVGAQGIDGIQGSQGVQGEVGAQGVQGENGAQGLGGTQGSQGVQGEIGVQGVQGDTGTQGTQGIQGEFGTQGVQGTTGTQGTQGEVGAQGTQGVQGELGVQGTQGTDGTQGSQGTIGSQGTQGIVGEQGEFGGASFDYIYTTNTANTNPGNGYVAFDNTNWPSVTRLYISQLDGASVNVANYLETIDDSTSTIKGTFKVANTANVTLEFAFFNINGFNTYQNNYFSVPTAYLNGISGLPDNTNVVITFVRTGDKGDTGLQGSTGTQGTQGTQGVFGTQGTQGVQGTTGTQGTQGETGTQGTQGVQGTQGTQGIDGTLGSQGPLGTQGIQGVYGTQGTQGETGTQGTQGIQGVYGAQGTQGTQGTYGTQGTDGAQGIQGETGTQGTGGVQGSDGVQGSFGLQGSQGEVGSQGVQGDVGTQGIAGIGFQGAVGSQGVQGDDGVQGSIGAQGAGTQGSQGIQGRQGVQGAIGSQGLAGTNGNQGTIGPQGVQGAGGAQGSQGTQGFGAQGAQGIQGSNGAQGSQGFGAQGVQGATGTQGAQGIQGLQGPEGLTAQGTTDNVAKFTGANTIGNSILVNSGGTVGVGTANPNTRLHIFENNIASTNVADILKIETNRADFTGIGGSAIVFKNQDSNNLTNEGRIKVVTENDGSLGVNNEATSSFIFSLTENGVAGDKVIFRGDGNVGVGTLTPGTKIDAAGSIRASQQLISTVATGTAPLQVVSNTVVANLNADLLDGYTTSTTADASTVAIRNAQASLLANQFSGNSVTVTGSVNGASLTITGTGQFGTNVTASRLISNVAVGTAPLIVVSNTVVTNLNAQFLGGNSVADLDNRYVNVTGDTMTGTLNMHESGTEGHITFGSDSATSSGIRKHSDGEAEFYIYSKDTDSTIFIATGYDGSVANPSRPTDGISIAYNRIGIGDFSSDDPLYRLHAKGDIYANGGHFRVSNANGIIWETYGQRILAADNQYLRIRANNGILFTDTAQAAKGYLYWDNTSPETNFGLLNRSGGWAFRSNTTEAEIYGTFYFGSGYGNIMYDRDSSGYYVNPGGTSEMLNIDMNNGELTGVNALTFNDPGPNEGINWAGGNLWRIYESPDDLTSNSGGNLQFVTGTTWRFRLDTSGNALAQTSMRAPIFYDSDNTAYYLDPANSTTSLLTAGNVAIGAITTAGYNLNVPGSIRGGALYTDRYLIDSGDTNTYLDFVTSDQLRIVAGGVELMRWVEGGTIYTYTNYQIRAPIYYDNDDTGYYLDANNTSLLYNLNVASNFITSGDIYAPRLIDTNNNTYLIDPAGTSTLSGADLYGTWSLRSGNELRFYTAAGNLRGYMQSTDTDDAHLIIATSGGEDISFRDGGLAGDWNMIIRGDGNTLVREGLQARIFYDRDSTGYYLNPQEYSRLGRIVLDQARINTSQFPVGHYTPGETVFEFDPTWTNDQLQAYFNSASVSWVADSTAPGGYAISIVGGVNVGGVYGSGFPYIPVDQNDIFYMECWIRNVSGTNTHYMGSIDFNESFSSLGGNPGSFGYWTMSNTNPGTSWTKVTGYITGFGAATGQFRTGTKYWTPQALFNYTGGGTCYISGWKVIKVYQPGNRTVAGSFTAQLLRAYGSASTTSFSSAGQIALKNSSSPYISWHDDAGSRIGYLQHTGGRFYFGEGAYTQSEGSFRAPIFYDTDDTNVRWSGGTFVLRSSSPTIYFRDTDHNSAMLHTNSNLFYILRGANDSESWATTGNGNWPAYWNLTNNDMYAGRDIYGYTFYARDATGFYIDPDSTSNMRSLVVGGVNNGTAIFYRDSNPYSIGGTDAVVMVSDRSNADWGIIVDKSGFDYGIRVDVTNGASYGYGLYNGSSYRYRVHGGGEIYGTIFYDIDSTGYYVNPPESTQLHRVYADNWFRAQGTCGVYWESYDTRIYSQNSTYIYTRSDNGWIYQNRSASNQGYVYFDGNGFGLLHSGGSWAVNINPSDQRLVTIGGAGPAWNAYNTTTGVRLMLGGGNSDAQNNYYIGTNLENYGGNYNKLDIRWHTGIRMGAQPGYGGIRFYDTEDLGTEIFHIGKSGNFVQAAFSARAPIFYDVDTTYYFNGDDAGLDAGRIRGAWTHGPNPTWGAYIRFGGNGDAGDWAQVMTTNGNLHLDPRRGGYATYLNWYAGNPVYVENQIQATIFYDRNDPTYYVDPNSYSNWQGLTERAKAQIGLTGQSRSSTQYYNQRPNITGNSDYWTGTMGWGTVNMNTVADWGSGFIDSWSNPANQPAGTSHWVGVQSYHYTNGSARYGWQMVGGPISGLWFRQTWSTFGGWQKIMMYGQNEYASSVYATIYYDANDPNYYCDPNGGSRLNEIYTNESYTYGWHRNYTSGRGLYNQSSGMHWYSNNGYWKSAGGGYGYGAIVMYNNYESDLRGYCGYWDGSGFGMLNSSGNWQIRIEYGNANMELYRVTFGNDFRAYIYYDRDNTGYYFGGGQGEAQLAATYSNNWFRPQGCVGLYFQSYGRGIWSPECEGNPYGHIATYGGGRNGWYGYGAGSRWTLMTTVGDNFGLHDNARGNWLWYWDGSYTRWNYGYNYFSGDVRSWRFYDHDTSYYGDFNDWSRMWGIGTFYLRNNYDVSTDHPFGVAFANDQSTAYRFYRESGGWSYPYPDVRIAFHTGIKMGANGPSYEGLRIYSDYDMSGLLIQLNGSSSYSFWYTWQNLTGYHGIYSGINNAHFYPNPDSYGSWRSIGSRNGWGGIQFDNSICLMMNYSEHGFYSTALGWRLYLNGSVYSPGNVVAYWSDRRLKENIKELDRGEGLDKIMKLKPSRFNWRKEAEQVTNGIIVGGTEEVSVIAQEAQEVLPNAVVINKTAKKGVEIDGEVLNDYYTVNYDKITPFLIQAIKDLKKELDELKEELQKERNRNGTN